MQVDPIKPTFKAPEIKLFKVKHGGPLSIFAFDFNLRRFSKESLSSTTARAKFRRGVSAVKVGRCRLTLSNPR